MKGVSDLNIFLRRCDHPSVRQYLSENNLELQFSFLKRIYYDLARPVLPSPLRRELQRRYSSKIKCLESFIYPDLVELLKGDELGWEQFTRTLYPGKFKTAIVLSHDVETQDGYNFVPAVIELEARYGFRGSWNIVPHKYELHSEVIELIKRTGNEIGIHGYNHDGTLYYSKERFLFRAKHINAALKTFGAVGFRSPQVHRNLAWLQELDILYDASCFDYDPYQPFPGGTGSIWPFIAGKFVELPYTIPQDHVMFYLRKERDIRIWKRKADWVSENYGTVLTLTHPDYLREKDHLRLYEEFLAYLQQLPNAWHCLPRELAQWCMTKKVLVD
jgi:peptidoglycan/xylan/chitin deacetylase (PgdA/CDA1 family)